MYEASVGVKSGLRRIEKHAVGNLGFERRRKCYCRLSEHVFAAEFLPCNRSRLGLNEHVRRPRGESSQNPAFRTIVAGAGIPPEGQQRMKLAAMTKGQDSACFALPQ